jgi:hypothetical protein
MESYFDAFYAFNAFAESITYLFSMSLPGSNPTLTAGIKSTGYSQNPFGVHSVQAVSGTLGGKFNRKQTGKSDWVELEAHSTREGLPAVESPSPTNPPYGYAAIDETRLL